MTPVDALSFRRREKVAGRGTPYSAGDGSHSVSNQITPKVDRSRRVAFTKLTTEGIAFALVRRYDKVFARRPSSLHS